ncbi:MAG: hypothetical protein ABI999_18410 [Acidobacteriota bacterium]
MLKLTTTVALVLLASAITFAQVNPAKLKVNGSIGLDSTYAQIIKAFGKPSKDGRPKSEGCIGGREKTVEYAGLSFYMMDGDSKGGKTFEVKTFYVTSAKWIVSGVRVGDTQAAVKAKLGSKYRVDKRTDNGGLAWHYDMSDPDGPGTTTIVFRAGKVVEIGSAYQVC